MDNLTKLSDRELKALFEHTDGEGSEAERILREIERRNLDL